jgi:hypothetical protein
MINKYLEPPPDDYLDPLAAETALLASGDPGTIQLLNFSSTESTIGSWFNDALEELDQLLSNEVTDSVTGMPTLQINILLRKYILEDDGSYAVNMTNLPAGVVYEGHDRLTETVISIDAINIFGLDSFSEFRPFRALGSFTLQNEFTWDELVVELDMTVDMKASTFDDSLLITDPGSEPVKIIEKIKVTISVDQLDLTLALLLAMDQDALGSLQLGSALDTSNWWECISSVLYEGAISFLQVNVGKIQEPVLTGFVSSGIDQMISSVVTTSLTMYEPTIMKALPNFFQVFVRDLLNKRIVDQLLAYEAP